MAPDRVNPSSPEEKQPTIGLIWMGEMGDVCQRVVDGWLEKVPSVPSL